MSKSPFAVCHVKVFQSSCEGQLVTMCHVSSISRQEDNLDIDKFFSQIIRVTACVVHQKHNGAIC